MKWQHPELGEISEMRPRERELKGWKHLYDPLERWEQLVGTSVATMHSQARANGCRAWYRPAQGSRHPRLSASCRACLGRHHDQLWRAAYGEALMAPESRIGRDRFWRGNPVVVASPRGVWLVLSLDADRVFNAFRPHPPGQGVDWEEQDFAAQASRRYEQNTGMAMRDRLRQLQRNVQRPAEVWHLALAVGAALADPQPEEAQALQAAKARLATLPEALRKQALPRLEDLQDSLEAALDEDAEDLDDATTAVLAVEDALVATEVLLGESAASQLQEALVDLVAWAPEAWQELNGVVAARSRETVGVAQGWWYALDEVLGALLVSTVPVAHAPDAPLARQLTAPSWWDRWAKELSTVAHGLVEPKALGVQFGLAHLGGDDDPWEVTGSSLPDDVQVFVVDADTPDGEAVTEDLAEDGPFWQLEEPGQEACIVRIQGIPRASDLASALEEVGRTPSAGVQISWVSRPS